MPSTSKPQPSSDTMAWTISRRRWSTTLAVRAPECFAEFEVNERRSAARKDESEDEMVQVTVVLRGKRGELEDPALGMTELVLRALETRTDRGRRDVIDAMGIAVEPAYAG